MFAEKQITGSSLPPNSVLPADRIRPQPTWARMKNRLAARHALKSFLKDISRSRLYDNSAQPNANRFSRRREEQNAFRS
jgi:hypothetical protein